MIYISHLMEDEILAELLEEGRKRGEVLGVESIEFGIGFELDKLPQTLKSYEKRLEKLGRPPLTLHGPFLDLNGASYDTRIQKATKERFQQAYDAAEYLGASKIVYHSGFIPQIYLEEGWAERMAQFWTEFLDGKGESIQICMENVLDRNYRLVREVCKRINHPAFALCLDIGHAHVYSPYPVEEWIAELGKYAGHIHLHDNRKDKDSHLALGEGTIPVEKVLKLLKKHCSQATCTLENRTKEEVLQSLERIGIM